MNKVAHLTSVHPRYDTRIFEKECISLANNGFDVFLIVSDNRGEETKNNLKIIDVGSAKNRFYRIFFIPYLIYKKAIEVNADLYHFHDPELIFCGLFLKMKGKKVIYDVHEDVPLQIMNKHYLPEIIKRTVSKLFNFIEKKISKRFNYIFTATDFIKEIFLKINKSCETINNYPIIGQLCNDLEWKGKENAILYVGSINEFRGVTETIRSLEFIETNVIFYLAGNFGEEKFHEKLKKEKFFEYVRYQGFINKIDYKELCSKSKIGLIIDQPIENYIDAFATKMFEYMEAGIPFICSDFPKWKEFVRENNCGICVNPNDHYEISNAINFLLGNDVIAEDMGKNGKKAVYEKYNWTREEQKLISIYYELLGIKN
jgi:glycosyltransferase involved in cell wall biosynthesis